MTKRKALSFAATMFLLSGVIFLSAGLLGNKHILSALGCANVALAATYLALARREAKVDKGDGA